jgi:hypothetical protein
MLSFDVVLLFTKLPIKEPTDLLGCHFEEGILGRFHHVLTNSFFTFNRQFYGQIDRVAMGSPLSPVIANFYMEDYEKEVLQSVPRKPHCWFCYVVDTFVIWLNGQEKQRTSYNI